MTIIMLGKWRSKADGLFIYERIHWNDVPLPLVKIKFRYVG